ncbi:cytochrome c-type biogenesis protein [Achromobacter sp. F4_2707]|uniref:cytochrome c-type biogenesis protein n=1 Tax=Achromobacter sp. F4_2707 TaxID=3114286 RepID=UPI0039C63931
MMRTFTPWPRRISALVAQHLPRTSGLFYALALCLAVLAAGLAAPTYAAENRLPPAEESRLRELARDLRCLVCQNESLAESHAPLAADLRDEIREQISAGYSDKEVIQYLVDRYGDFVTYKPPFNSRTLLLWFGPFAVLLLLLWVLWSFHKRGRPGASQATAEEDRRETHEEFRRLKRQYGSDDD